MNPLPRQSVSKSATLSSDCDASAGIGGCCCDDYVLNLSNILHAHEEQCADRLVKARNELASQLTVYIYLPLTFTEKGRPLERG